MATPRAMSEHDWMKSTNPGRLLSFLHTHLSARRRRLFACACCRTARALLDDKPTWEAVLLAERFADGLATARELDDAREAVNQLYADTYERVPRHAIRATIRCSITAAKDLRQLNFTWADVALALELTSIPPDELYEASEEWEDAANNPFWETDLIPGEEMAHLLRDIVGNPFQRVAFDPAWRTSDVVALARGIYDDRAFDRMPILADALQDAGCNNRDILNHCRNTSKLHTRGCWVVDLALGKS
jgi:hypothetical protein